MPDDDRLDPFATGTTAKSFVVIAAGRAVRPCRVRAGARRRQRDDVPGLRSRSTALGAFVRHDG